MRAPMTERPVALPPGKGVLKMDQFLHNHADGVFDPEAVRILTTALNEAWKAINTTGISFASRGHAEAARETLAKRIIELARNGERDQCRLSEDALLHLTQQNLKTRPAATP
jgi:hypothetical protein